MYQDFQVFSSITIAIFLEAAPFLLLGSLVSGIFQVMVAEDRLLRLLPRGQAAGVVLGLFSGMLLPTCECGVVPIARRLLNKGVPPSAAVTYMLAAPVINPVVIISTWVAFAGDWPLVLGRMALVAVPAAVMGLTLGQHPARDILKGGGAPAHDHDHHHDHGPQPLASLAPGEAGAAPAPACGCAACAAEASLAGRPRVIQVLLHAGAEFMEMGKYLLLGSLAAAAFKAFLPSHWLFALESNLLLSVAGMMLLAVLLSVCSEADAFVAASFSSFAPEARLAFVAIGPMVDLKLIAAYLGVFRRPAALGLIVVPCLLVFSLAVLLGLTGVLTP